MTLILSGILLLLLVITTSIFWLTLVRYESKKRFNFLLLIISVWLHVLGYLFEINSTGIEASFLSYSILHFGGSFLVPFLFLYIAEFANIKIKRPLYFAIMVYALLGTVLQVTSPYQAWYFQRYFVDSSNTITHFSFEAGVTYLPLHLGYYAMFAATFAILAYHYLRGSRQTRRQTLLLLIGTTPCVIGNALYALRLDLFGGLNFTPISMVIAISILHLAITRFNLFDLIPLASRHALQSMKDAFIILDNDKFILEANPAAADVFPETSHITGRLTVRALKGWPDALSQALDETHSSQHITEFTIDTQTHRNFRANITRITSGGNINGWLLIIYDITDSVTLLNDLEKRTSELNTHNNLMLIVNDAATLLMNSDKDRFTNAMARSMEIVGKGIGVSRIGIWKNDLKNGDTLFYRLEYQWSSASGPYEIEVGTEYPYREVLPNWGAVLARGDNISGPLRSFANEEAEHLSARGIRSTLNIPIFLNEEYWGFAAFEDCHNDRAFTEGEARILRSWGLLTVGAVRRYEILLDYEAAVKTAEDASQSKSVFLANMSHEIRTPMNSIMGFAELAADKTKSGHVKDYLAKITDSTKWLLRIINDILDISKIESGKMEMENVPFDLHDIFARCQSVILSSVNEKGLNLHMRADPITGKMVLGDPVRLYQALMNLLSNAVKFTSAGEIKMSSTIAQADDSTATVRFEISDSGIGMSVAQIDKIFDPFMQADASTTRNYGGTGLGLSITKNIVELMGGRLTVESEPGVGSTFRFELVFNTIESLDEEVVRVEANEIEKPHFDGLILICDDNNMNRQLICEHLERLGLRTVTAENGKIGVDMVRERIQTGQQPYDLILMDVYMPVMDGVEAAARITELGTGAPIVAMTANIMTNDLERYRKNGMSDYLGKPFTSQELWRCLLKHLAPVGVSTVDVIGHTRENDSLQKKLAINFAKSNQTTYGDILGAIDTGDMTLAHRLVHTLKGNAGQIGKTALQNAAAEAEEVLKHDAVPPAELMETIKKELHSVLDELAPVLDTPAGRAEREPPDADWISALFSKLEPMLKSRNADCVDLLDDLRSVPEAEKLARQIETYEFKQAAQTLAELMKGRV